MDQLYSFIDVVALEPVRGAFASGEALVIFSRALDEVIWTNGPGAHALNFTGIEAAIGAENPLPALARRQIAATPGYPNIGSNKPVSIRLNGLLTTRLTRLILSEVTLPDGEEALLVIFADEAGSSEPSDALRSAISGFGAQGQSVAMLDKDGAMLAATSGFERAGIAQADLAALVQSAGSSPRHVAKRRLRSRQGLLPAGLARLSDDPALHFLIVIGDADADGEVEESVVSLAPAVMPAPSETAAPEAVEPIQPIAPLRFVWRTDSGGRFSALSVEFLDALAIDEAAIIGRSFRDIAGELGFDQTGEIAGLLERRDTWSGRSVLWPLAASTLHVPVDLAALPIYDRDRVFEGFRGFGVARLGDAVTVTKTAAETSLDAGAPADEAHEDMAPVDLVAPPETAEDPFAGEPPALVDAPGEDDDKVVRLAAHRQALAERAALNNSERSAFREIGNRLKAAGVSREAEPPAPVEPNSTEATTPHDAPADFEPHEAERAPAETSRAPALADATDNETTAVAEPEELGAPVEPYDAARDEDLLARAAVEGDARFRTVPPLGTRASEALPDIHDDEEPDAAPALLDDPVSPALAGGATLIGLEQEANEAPVEPEPPAQDPLPLEAAEPLNDAQPSAEAGRDAPHQLAESEADIADADSAVQPMFVGIEPLPTDAPLQAHAISDDHADLAETSDDPLVEEPGSADLVDADLPTFAPAENDLELLDSLPIALIIHAGDRLDFANREFFALTGYDTLEGVMQAGGLEALFVATDGSEPNNRCPFLRTLGGEDIPVHAHLQSVPWGGGKSLMLSLRRAVVEPQATVPPSADQQAPAASVEPPSNVTRLPLPAKAPSAPPAVEQKTADELARTRALLAEMRAIIDTATDGVILITPEGKIRNISRPAEALFGMDSSSVEGQPFTSLFAIESQRAIKDYLQGLTDNGVASVLNDGREVIGRETQGGFIPLFITIGRLPGESGFCAVVREITQWKRAEEELTQARAEAERSSSQKSDFLARVSHEIRTPLNAIIGFSELMMEERFGPVGNERYRDYLRDINRSGNHVLDLVNDLLDISKIEAGEQELAYVAVSLNDTLAETVAIMQPQANRERVIIRSSFASRLPDVVADLRSVRQIALNLLSNAVRYTQAGGQVIVSTVYEPSGEVILRIRDTGVGMSSAEIDQALRPFKQVNALKRARGDGTGLGLPLTKAMVEANRARFVINSRPGDGTLVEVTFPSTRVLAD